MLTEPLLRASNRLRILGGHEVGSQAAELCDRLGRSEQPGFVLPVGQNDACTAVAASSVSPREDAWGELGGTVVVSIEEYEDGVVGRALAGREFDGALYLDRLADLIVAKAGKVSR